MSGVDVRAVLDDELIKARSRGDEQGHAHLREARAAVAELVEKGRFAQEAMMLRDWHVRVDNEGEARGRRKAHDDLAAALARFAPAAPAAPMSKAEEAQQAVLRG